MLRRPRNSVNKIFTFLVQPGQCSWLEVHNFIGDLMAASAPLRDQRIDETLSSAWDMARPKVSHLSQSNPSRSGQVKSTVAFGLPSVEREKVPRDHESTGE